jgi:hypothetical protein
MRTTVDIPDMLYRQLKTRAATEGRSVKELILRGVQGELREGEVKQRRRVKLPIVRSKKPGSVILNNARIYEIIPFP